MAIFFRFGWSGYSFGSGQEVFKTCPLFHVYDPFFKSCRRALPLAETNTSVNCTLVLLKDDEYVIFQNQTLFLKSQKKTYGEKDYHIDKRDVYLCSNVSTERRPESGDKILEMITYSGCGVSITALLFLLFTYGMFPKLRNVPGKNLMNLGSALLLYQALLLAAFTNGTRTRGVCVAIATGLHYLILTSFAWMAVLGFDVSRTFAARGKWREYVKIKVSVSTPAFILFSSYFCSLKLMFTR